MSDKSRIGRREFLRLAGIAGIALVGTAAGCTAPQAGQPASSSVPATGATSSASTASSSGGQPILVGVNAPLTGVFSGMGQGGTFGMQAAVDDINKLGGVDVKEAGGKLPLKLVIVDNESDDSKAGTLEEQLIVSDKVKVNLVNISPAPLVIPCAGLADRYKIPMISGGPMEPWLGARQQATPPWKYSWLTGFAIATPGPSGSFWAKPGYTIVDTWMGMLDQFGSQTNKKVALFASNDADGAGWYALFPKVLKDAGYDPVGVDKSLGLLPLETTDFTSLINEWKNSAPDILWGNAPAPLFGTLWRQAQSLGFKPKIVSIGKATLFYTDINAWGGDLPNGVGGEVWWNSSWKDSPGIGDTTPQSLTDRWTKAMNQPLNPMIGWGYQHIQVLVDAIQRAGSLDGAKINDALAKTDIMTIAQRVKFDDQQFSQMPLAFGQWLKTDKAQKWEQDIVYSKLDFVPTSAKPLFPIPYQ